MTKLTIYRGDSKTYSLSFTDGTNPINITGYTIFFTVKAVTDNATDDTNALITKTVTSHTDAANGLTSVVLSSTDTDIIVGSHLYDFQYKTDTGEIATIEKGTYQVLEDVTKRTS